MTTSTKPLPFKVDNFQDYNILPYWFSNSKINNGQVYLVQQASSVGEALHIIYIWLTEGYNIGATGNTILNIPYTLYIYNSNDDITIEENNVPEEVKNDLEEAKNKLKKQDDEDDEEDEYLNVIIGYLNQYSVLVYNTHNLENIVALLPYNKML